MLLLKQIKKDYPVGDGVVHALKGIDLRFRRAEFVAILGQSGCGKTTMLNIIGGLDSYTEGDLVINGTSTKEYKDRDWDTYRNHSIGFVFQNYHLIPHQSVLQNVELALTLSGVSKAERRAKAKKVLEEVGLGDQLKKKPNEMSGGQMQRVAIARALVNDPDIILADEPTGALDTETSVQVMEILKKISSERLVIMVTHNPDLADRYASRTINMLDGLVTNDSMPLTEEEIHREVAYQQERKTEEKKRKQKKPSMSFRTSFMLSLKNLFTKKGRTTLTAFAGSIGIIGIALILAVSQGMTMYINAVQESTLSAYPLSLEASTVELTTLMETFMNVSSQGGDHQEEGIYKKEALFNIISAVNNMEETENDLKSFNEYLSAEMQKEDAALSTAVNGIQYSYDLDLQIYTENVDGKILRSDTEAILQDLIIQYLDVDMSGMATLAEASPMSSMSNMSINLWQELLTGKDGAPINDLLYDQYDMIYGSWPNSYDEIVLVVDQNNELDDVTLYALGLLPQEQMDALANAALYGSELEKNDSHWTYEEICSMDFRAILNADCYAFDEVSGLYHDLRESEAGLRYLYDNALRLKVTGIIRPSEEADVAMLTGSIGYTQMLTKYLIEKAENAPVIQAQLNSPDKDVVTGLPFDTTTGTLTAKEKEQAFREYAETLTDGEKATTFLAINCIPPTELVEQQTNESLSAMSIDEIRTTVSEALSMQVNISEAELNEYLEKMSDEELIEIFVQLLHEQIRMQYAQQVMTQMAASAPEQLIMGFDMALPTYTTEQCALYYDEIMEFSASSYEENLLAMGYVHLESPAAIHLYASSFENKDVITESIAAYNDTVDEMQQIKYTDYIGLMMSSVTTIINAITYVLIAFVAISLVVSSIMIAVITLISVQERTKEIGILRAIGASKRNVSSMFNAETVIVGFAAGLLGVAVTYLLCIPINLILNHLTGIENLRAVLPVSAAVILVAISVILNLISGLIPSRSAAKKDPVVALRTE